MAMRHSPGSRSNPPHLRPVRDYWNAKEIVECIIGRFAIQRFERLNAKGGAIIPSQPVKIRAARRKRIIGAMASPPYFDCHPRAGLENDN